MAGDRFFKYGPTNDFRGLVVNHQAETSFVADRILILGLLELNFSALDLIQLTSGLFWGIYESALTIILFRRVSAKSKVALLSIVNFVPCVAILLGSLVGGWILKSGGETIAGYGEVFATSAILRVSIVLVFVVIGIQPQRGFLSIRKRAGE